MMTNPGITHVFLIQPPLSRLSTSEEVLVGKRSLLLDLLCPVLV
jgi:hypothetical protein